VRRRARARELDHAAACRRGLGAIGPRPDTDVLKGLGAAALARLVPHAQPRLFVFLGEPVQKGNLLHLLVLGLGLGLALREMDQACFELKKYLLKIKEKKKKKIKKKKKKKKKKQARVPAEAAARSWTRPC
jgi:hypothetical protein